MQIFIYLRGMFFFDFISSQLKINIQIAFSMRFRPLLLKRTLIFTSASLAKLFLRRHATKKPNTWPIKQALFGLTTCAYRLRFEGKHRSWIFLWLLLMCLLIVFERCCHLLLILCLRSLDNRLWWEDYFRFWPNLIYSLYRSLSRMGCALSESICFHAGCRSYIVYILPATLGLIGITEGKNGLIKHTTIEYLNRSKWMLIEFNNNESLNRFCKMRKLLIINSNKGSSSGKRIASALKG